MKMGAMNELVGERDAVKWAQKFVMVAELRPDIPCDEGTMIGWFANAIEAGYDAGRRDEKLRGFHSMIREIAYLSAGAGSGAVMVEAPDVIMPSREIETRVEQILNEFGIPTEEVRHDQRLFSGAGADSEPSDTCAQTARSKDENRQALGYETGQDRLLREHRPMESRHR
jgi:hypothetical protein